MPPSGLRQRSRRSGSGGRARAAAGGDERAGARAQHAAPPPARLPPGPRPQPLARNPSPASLTPNPLPAEGGVAGNTRIPQAAHQTPSRQKGVWRETRGFRKQHTKPPPRRRGYGGKLAPAPAGPIRRPADPWTRPGDAGLVNATRWTRPGGRDPATQAW